VWGGGGVSHGYRLYEMMAWKDGFFFQIELYTSHEDYHMYGTTNYNFIYSQDAPKL